MVDTRVLPNELRPLARSLDRLLETLRRNRGFILLPVEVRGPDIARVLSDFLTQSGLTCTLVDPGYLPQPWEELPATIVTAFQAQNPKPSLVLVIGSAQPPSTIHAGLSILNQRRDTLVKTLDCPLLWCGPAEFLNLTWDEAPDFWSIRAVDIRLLPDENESNAKETLIPPALHLNLGSASNPEIESLQQNRQHAYDRGDFLTTTRLSVQLIDELLKVKAVDPASQVLEQVFRHEETSKSGPLAIELALRKADVEAQRNHPVAAAATLGALLARNDLTPYVRASAGLRLGRLLEDGGDTERAEAAYKGALVAARESGDAELIARALIGAYAIEARTGREASAEAPLREAETLAKRLRNDELTAAALAALASFALAAEDRQEGAREMDVAKRLRDQNVNQSSRSPAQKTVDILVLTALQDELDGVLSIGTGWQEHRDLAGFRYFRRDVSTSRGTSFSVAAAWIGEMGQRSASIRGEQLKAELAPSCLAMCGICAGYRDKVALGDIIVADRLFAYDEGKRHVNATGEATFSHSIRTFDLNAVWKVDASFLAREIDVGVLERERPPGKDAQRKWILHTLYAHETEGKPAPMQHPDRAQRCPEWTARLKELLEKGFVMRRGATLTLTDQGRDVVFEDLLTYPDGIPPDPPSRVHVGTVATGSAVVEDAGIFQRLRKIERSTIGLEMEGTALGELAARAGVQSIFVKAVVDYADHEKDDGFRRFACRASAWFLFAFLEKHFEPRKETRETRFERRERQILGLLDHEREHPFLHKVEAAAKARFQDAKITRHATALPFVGLLQLDVEKNGFTETQLVAALDQTVTTELVQQFALLEQPFRADYPPLRSTIVYRGDTAPSDLAVAARRRGIHLATFYEYQALFDLTKYLEWQTARLRTDPVYPPAMYVDPPATYEVQGSREQTRVDNALHYMLDLLRATDQPRFALVIGDFGAGKTFLLRELARRMVEEKHPVWPVLIEMHRLEKQTELPALLAAHFAVADVPGYNFKAFQYMLNEGRIALLFDGFDELAGHVVYDAVTKHFETVLSATTGERAKVVLSSRRQHFLSDAQIKGGVQQAQIKLVLADKASTVPGFRLVVLDKFEPLQIRQYLRNVLGDERQANERYALIDEVKDLLGLSHNPRMLGFIVRIPEASLREAKRKHGTITAAGLYDLLVKEWLDFEHQRSLRISVRKGISREALSQGIGELAVSAWQSRMKHVQVDQIRDVVAAAMQRLGEPPLHADVLAQMFGSGSLLVRDGEGRFSFVHRSVLEWFVARDAAKQVEEHGDSALLAVDELSALMADFFSAMATREKAIPWARGKLEAHEKGPVAKNATLVLRRLGESFERLDFAGHDLRGQDFSGVDWRGADLRGANLEGATLVGADLSGANLVGARLYRANLTNARLVKARLDVVDLRIARLLQADLTRAEGLDSVELFRTNFAGAKLPDSFDAAKVDRYGVGSLVGKAVPLLAGSATACNSVAWDPRGELLAAGFADGTVRIFDALSGEALRVLVGHRNSVSSVVFSPDGKTLCSGSYDNSVRVWNVHEGRELHKLEGHQNWVMSVAFSPDGKTVASGSFDASVRLWDVFSGREIRTLEGHQNSVRSVAFSPDGKTLGSGSDDDSLRLWDVPAGRQLRTLKGHQGAVYCVAFSPDGKTLCSGSYDNSVRLWDVHAGREIRTLEGHPDSVFCVAFSPDGKTLCSGSWGNSMRLWDVSAGREIRTLEGHQNSVRSVAFSPDGKTLGSGSDDNSVRLWDVPSGREIRTLEGHRNAVYSVVFSPDGKTLCSGSDDHSLRLWDVPAGRELLTLEGHQDSVLSVAFSPDGKTLCSGSADHSLRLRDVHSGRPIRPLQGHEGSVMSVAFSPDGKILCSGSSDNSVRLWDVVAGRELLTLEGHQDSVLSVAFSPDGKTLCSGSADNSVRLWDVPAGRPIRTLQGHHFAVYSVAFSPDGKTLCSGSTDNSVRLWDVFSGREIRTLEGHQNSVFSVAFSPDGKTLCSGSRDNSVRLWDVFSGREIHTLEGHQDAVRSVAFSPDGKTVASGSSDGTLRLWDIASGQNLAILFATPDGWVAFTPDGHYKFSGNLGGSFWHVVGLCRFEVGELDALVPGLRLADDAPLLAARAP